MNRTTRIINLHFVMSLLILILSNWPTVGWKVGAPIVLPLLESDKSGQVPRRYYSHACPVQNGENPQVMYNWLSNLSFTVPYEEHGFDCSQSSAFLEWVLENCGYETAFYLSTNHVWLRVELFPGLPAFYESTGPGWINYDDLPEYQKNEMYVFDDIREAIAYTRKVCYLYNLPFPQI